MKEQTRRRVAALENDPKNLPLSLRWIVWDAVSGDPPPLGWEDPEDPLNPVLRIEIVDGTEETE